MIEATMSGAGTDRTVDVLARVTTVLAGADLEFGTAGSAVLERALDLLGTLPGVTGVRLAPEPAADAPTAPEPAAPATITPELPGDGAVAPGPAADGPTSAEPAGPGTTTPVPTRAGATISGPVADEPTSAEPAAPATTTPVPAAAEEAVGAEPAAGLLTLPLRAPAGFLLVEGDPDATTRCVLGSAADMLGAVLRSRERVRLAAAQARRARVLVESSTDLVLVVDVEGMVVDVNEAAGRMLGGRDRLLGRPAVELIASPPARADLPAAAPGGDLLGLVHPDDRASAAAAFRTLIGAGADEDADPAGTPALVRLRGGGGWRWMSVLGHDLRADPAVRAVVLTLRDVTRRREAERRSEAAHSRLANLIDNLTQGVLFEDDDRHLLLTNRAFVELFDLPATPEQMTGGSMDELLDASAAMFVDPYEYVSRMRARMADRVPVLGDELLTVDGRVLERDFVPIVAEGEDRGHLWIFRDVTKRKREEERLAEEYQRLVGVTAAKNRFVASVSHELRTPLTSIVSFSGLLADPESGPLTEEQQDFLEIVERNGNRLIRLVGDLMLLSRLESGAIPLEMEDVDPAGLALTAARAQQLTAADSGVDLQVWAAPGAPVVGDADRLSQAVDNLLSNAIKFTPPGGRVSVTAVPDGEGWTVEISDTGIGIPTNEQHLLFSEFYRASNSRTDRTPGTGLGLVISRLIAERHGGDLRLISEEGRGTTAVLRLPTAGRRRMGW